MQEVIEGVKCGVKGWLDYGYGGKWELLGEGGGGDAGLLQWVYQDVVESMCMCMCMYCVNKSRLERSDGQRQRQQGQRPAKQRPATSERQR